MSSSDDTLATLVTRLTQAGLRGPSLLILELLSPLDLISAQLASFSSPFVRGTTVEPLLNRLAEPEAWAELRRQLAHQD